ERIRSRVDGCVAAIGVVAPTDATIICVRSRVGITPHLVPETRTPPRRVTESIVGEAFVVWCVARVDSGCSSGGGECYSSDMVIDDFSIEVGVVRVMDKADAAISVVIIVLMNYVAADIELIRLHLHIVSGR